MQRMGILVDANERSLWVLWSLETESNFAPYLITWEKGGASVMSAIYMGGWTGPVSSPMRSRGSSGQ